MIFHTRHLYIYPVSIKHGLRTTDCGLDIKHGQRYKTQTKDYGLGIKYGLRYKTRTVDKMWPNDCGLGIKHNTYVHVVLTNLCSIFSIF